MLARKLHRQQTWVNAALVTLFLVGSSASALDEGPAPLAIGDFEPGRFSLSLEAALPVEQQVELDRFDNHAVVRADSGLDLGALLKDSNWKPGTRRYRAQQNAQQAANPAPQKSWIKRHWYIPVLVGAAVIYLVTDDDNGSSY